MEARLFLTYDDEQLAEAVAKAISPDNVDLPPYLSVETTRSGKQVITHVRYEEKRFGTFISTIDDLLRCVSVAEKALSNILTRAPAHTVLEDTAEEK